jgi:hypothetical protein
MTKGVYLDHIADGEMVRVTGDEEVQIRSLLMRQFD